MDGLDARVPMISPRRPAREAVTTFGALARSGFRRYATYRQATIAGAFTNVVFGFLRCYVLLAVAAATVGGQVAGYDEAQLATYVWVGQGLLSVIWIGHWDDLALRIRSGDVAADLLRPMSPVTSYLAADLGRAGHAMTTRFVPPVIVGMIFFPIWLPGRWQTVPLFAVSILLAVIGCFGVRYLINSIAYWLHDARGPMLVWLVSGGILSGLYFPLRMLPDWLAIVLYVGTPFPSMLQTPLDVLVERDSPLLQAGLVLLQVFWASLLLLACGRVQRMAERRLVVQGG